MKIFLDANFLIYLNTYIQKYDNKFKEFFKRLLNENLYTDLLVIDEVLYISKKKYNVPYKKTIEFFEDVIIPVVEILPIRIEEYLKAKEYILKYNLNPSDALHLAVINNNGIEAIVTEDIDFKKVPIKVIWLNDEF